jgi:hypothetical protein
MQRFTVSSSVTMETMITGVLAFGEAARTAASTPRPAHARHQQVEEDRVVGVVAGELERLLAGAGELRLDVELVGQHAREEQPGRFLIVDDEDAVPRRYFFVRWCRHCTSPRPAALFRRRPAMKRRSRGD